MTRAQKSHCTLIFFKILHAFSRFQTEKISKNWMTMNMCRCKKGSHIFLYLKSALAGGLSGKYNSNKAEAALFRDKASAEKHRLFTPADAFSSCCGRRKSSSAEKKSIHLREVSARRIAFYLSDRTNAHYLGIGAPL